MAWGKRERKKRREKKDVVCLSATEMHTQRFDSLGPLLSQMRGSGLYTHGETSVDPF